MKLLFIMLCTLFMGISCIAQQTLPAGTVFVKHAPITGDSIIAIHASTATLEDGSVILYVMVFHQMVGDQDAKEYTATFDFPKGYFKQLIPTAAEKMKAIKDKMGLIVVQ